MKKISLLSFYLFAAVIFTQFFLCQFSYCQQITWSRTYGETGAISEQGVDVLQTYDGNYVVLGTRSYDGNNQKILLLKLDSYGNRLWEKEVADSIQHHNPYSFEQTNDSGFIITGICGSAFLIKTDKNGNLKWRKIYTNDYPQTYSVCVKTTHDNGFILCGRVPLYSPPSDRGYIVKTDPAGNVQWEKTYEDSLFTDYNEIIRSNGDDGYYVVGRTYNITQPLTYYTIVKKLTLTGEVIWSNTFGKNSTGLNIMLFDNSSLIINSSKQSPFTPRIFRIDTSGSIIWDRSFTSPNFSGSYPRICKDSQNNIQKVGGINGNISYTEISPAGSQLILRPFQTSGFLSTYGNVIRNTSDGGFIITGSVRTGTSTNPFADLLVIKSDSSANAPVLVKITSNHSSVISDYELYQNFPNPFNSQTNIRFKIPNKDFVSIKLFDFLGKEILTLVKEELDKGEYKVSLNSNDLSSGIYFYRLQTKNYSQTRKLTIVR